jgi:phosphate:Na+ symporter
MDELEIGVAVAAGIILFLFGIEQFSKEIQAVAGARFRRFLAKSTQNKFAGFALGAGVTAVIQSSTATSVIAVGLVNAGLVTFRQSLGVIVGANVGTTVTASLVALKLTDFAPTLILFGFVAGLLPFRWRVFGRSIFYFGLVFFSLSMVSTAVAPLRGSPEVAELLAGLSNPLVSLLAGAAFTALVQSSSVTTGLAIVLLQQGAIDLEQALPLILGANIGTTITAAIASARFDTSARRTAVSHGLYNIIGALLFLPIIGPFGEALGILNLDDAKTLAVAHFGFNVITAVAFLAILTPFSRLVERIVGDDADDEEPVDPLPEAAFGESAVAGRAAVRGWAAELVRVQRRCYTAAVLGLETQDRKIDNRAQRLHQMVEYAIEEATELVRGLTQGEPEEEHSSAVLKLVVTIDHARQLQDSFGDLMKISKRLDKQHTRFGIDSLLEVQAVYPICAKLLETLADVIETPDEEDARVAMARAEVAAEAALQRSYVRFLELVRKLDERGELADFLSIHQRMRTKVHAFGRYITSGKAVPEPIVPVKRGE